MEAKPLKKVCLVVSSPLTAKWFLGQHLQALGERYDVFLLANFAERAEVCDHDGKVTLCRVPIVRSISPFRDVLALALLFNTFRRCRFDVIHSVTPKAGLLSTIAGWLAGVPIRVHTFTGQVWVTRYGLTRCILRSADKIIASFATHVLVDSFSQRAFIIDQGIVDARKAQVLAAGSLSGVDTRRFRPDSATRCRMRSAWGARDDDVIFLYVGRLNRDKGIADLARAFSRLAARRRDGRLAIVGPDEQQMTPVIYESCKACRDRVHLFPYTDRPEDYMAAADVLCLPSYREGFGSVVIEAASAGIPAVASRIYGVTDAVLDEETGLLHRPGDIAGLSEAMERMIQEREMRLAMGLRAQRRAQNLFSQEVVTAALMRFYAALPKSSP